MGPLIIEPLSWILDDKMSANNFVALATRIGFKDGDITQLKLCYAGGGSPALTFLRVLCVEKASTEVSTLIRILEMDRMPDDAAALLTDYRNDVLGVVPPDVLQQLSTKLTQKEVGHVHTKDWTIVAAHFKFSQSEIDAISSAVRQNAIYSPTEQLFRMFRTQKPDYRLVELSEDFGMIKNEVAKQKLDQFIEDEVEEILKSK